MDNRDYQEILERIVEEVKPLLGLGKVASYIPELAHVDPNQFGMAVCTLDGQVYWVGDAYIPFSIQSISKLFAFTLAFQLLEDEIWLRIGREPSGTAFNSLIQLEYESGKPRNPFINAGALVVTDVLCRRFVQAEQALVQFLRRLSNQSSVDYNPRVAASELSTSFRNTAMAYLIKSYGNLEGDVAHIIDVYCKHCAIEMCCEDLARAMSFLANDGVIPWSSQKIIDTQFAKRINALMLTCGTYDAAGDFAYQVGLPAKSGVGGGIVAVAPGKFGVCAWSPGLAVSGNSLAAMKALELFTTYSGVSVFG